MGVVYLATDPKFGRRVALKVLAPELSGDENFQSRFVRESQMAAAIDHPNIIPVYDTGESEGVLFLAMRYVEGTDLREIIQREGQLDLTRAVSIVAQIGSALDAAHTGGLIHRDVKPANVLLTTLGDSDEPLDHVYLTDFGLTRRSDSRSRLTGTGGFMGTIDYMSPEQIKGEEVDGRTDLYALGCVFYECLTGVVPYERDSDVAVMYAHMMDERPLVSALRQEVPPQTDEIVARAMSRDPDDRWPTAAAMTGEIRRTFGMSDPGSTSQMLVAGGDRPARPASPTRSKTLGRRAAALALGAVMVIGTIGYLATRPDDKEGPPAGAHGPSDSPGISSNEGLAWQPAVGETLQLQLSGRFDPSYEADIYALELNDTPEATIEQLHADGGMVLCYLSGGAWEEWRPDADSFPVGVLGAESEGSSGVRWLDIRQVEALRPIISARLAECSERGADGVLFDNVDGYANRSGFRLTKNDQLGFDETLADLAHESALAAGFTNAPGLAAKLEPRFDFAVPTGCFQFDECDLYANFVAAGKPVFVIEFQIPLEEICDRADKGGFTAQRKKYNLGAWREACWE
ncbi:MAG: hypothetical protein QOG16_824 [Actinomycetota bacterium]|nr:hypothetical protein [Actinomycetota bacterium]